MIIVIVAWLRGLHPRIHSGRSGFEASHVRYACVQEALIYQISFHALNFKFKESRTPKFALLEDVDGIRKSHRRFRIGVVAPGTRWGHWERGNRQLTRSRRGDHNQR